MSQASKVGQVVFSQKTGVYMPALMCDKGDLFQEYEGEASAPISVAPDFDTMMPTISYLLTSSRVAEGIVVPSSVKWYFNGTMLDFANGVSTNSFNGEIGQFKEIKYAAGVNNYFGLQILKNLVKASGGAACNIKAVATVRVGNVADNIQCVYTIPITKGVGSMKKVTIVAGDNKYFALRDKGDSIIMRAMVYLGVGEITTGLSYKWYRMVSGVWQLVSGQTAKELTVNAGMVDTTGVFKVEVYQDNKLIGMDTQTVMDLSDPYDIITNPTPADETIVQGSGGQVTYNPKLVKRGSTSGIPGKRFFFTFMDSAGVVLNVATSKTPATSGTCTEAMCNQAGGNVNYIIETED